MRNVVTVSLGTDASPASRLAASPGEKDEASIAAPPAPSSLDEHATAASAAPNMHARAQADAKPADERGVGCIEESLHTEEDTRKASPPIAWELASRRDP